ncbi:importin-11-like [Clytia hemisphaerica]|uniref:importin-11-like n=1 Tax=Clytia hemisphaerica TaxID=252671 RepID=UPI0034D600E0
MENLVKALQLAASQNIQEVKAAEEQLKQWETTAGFYPKLLEIFAMRHLEVNIRWIAIICLKNGIDKYWRRVVKNCLPDDEKNFIKQNIMIFDEVTPELALQLSVVIGRIARNDIKIWPQCLEVTIEIKYKEDNKEL